MARKETEKAPQSQAEAQQPYEVKYSKEQIMKVAEQKFGLNRTEAVAAFFDAPAEMTVSEAEAYVKQFKERKVR